MLLCAILDTARPLFKITGCVTINSMMIMNFHEQSVPRGNASSWSYIRGGTPVFLLCLK